MKSPNRIALAAATLLTAIWLSPSAHTQEAQSITVVSWGGSYARASVRAYHERFEAETGIRIDLEEYSGGLAQIHLDRQGVETRGLGRRCRAGRNDAVVQLVN